MTRRMSLLSLVVLSFGLVAWQPPGGLTFDGPQQAADKDALKDAGVEAQLNPAFPPRGGFAFFSNGLIDCKGSTYSFNVTGAPPNVCGTLHMVVNGVPTTGPGWICSNGAGEASKGPWTVSEDKTGEGIYIAWPDGSRTSNTITKVDDATQPEITANTGGSGAVPTSFSGTASDGQWGSGFGSWTTVRVTFQNLTTGLYWDGSCYCSSGVKYFLASFSLAGDKWHINWSITPPPPSAHNPFHTYRWCAITNDRCGESNPGCVTF